MAQRLDIIAGPDAGRAYSLSGVDTLLLGRSNRCQGCLVDPLVSRVHCQVRVDEGRVLVTDALSTRGTFINGRRVVRDWLQPGDVLRVGTTELVLRKGAPEGARPAAAAGRRHPEPTPAAPEGWSLPSVRCTEPDPSAMMQLKELVGREIAAFQIGPVLDWGKSGLVFFARDTKRGRVVALKVLWPDFATDAENKERFVRAMRTSAYLRHPNVVRVYGAGKAGEYCWIAMEYVQGLSAARLIRHAGTFGRLDWRPALRVAIDIARALEFAHGQGIIHRNVTPTNVLIDRRTRSAKLGDLLLAKARAGTLSGSVTTAGEVLGDLSYLSPEQTQGTEGLDHRTDIYSLGATLYAMLAGQPPFEGTGPVELIGRILRERPVPPSEAQQRLPATLMATHFERDYALLQLEAFPPRLDDVILRMLAKHPADRYASARELRRTLQRLAAEE